MKVIIDILKRDVWDIVRDRKLALMIFLIPLVIAPLMLFFLTLSMDSQHNEKLVIAYQDRSHAILDVLEGTDRIELIYLPNQADMIQDIEREVVQLGISYSGQNASNNVAFDVYYKGISTSSLSALAFFQAVYEQYKEQELSATLHHAGISERTLNALSFMLHDLSPASTASLLIISLLPMLIVTYSCFGASTIAGEITVGERERGTLEPLLSTGVSWAKILTSKGITIFSFSFICSILSIAGIYLYIWLFRLSIIPFHFHSVSFFLVISCALSFGFSSTFLWIGFTAHSIKEMQTYSTILTILSMAPSYFMLNTSISTIPWYFFVIPLLNATSLAKEVIGGLFRYDHLLLIFGSTLGFAGFLLLFMVHRLKRQIC